MINKLTVREYVIRLMRVRKGATTFCSSVGEFCNTHKLIGYECTNCPMHFDMGEKNTMTSKPCYKTIYHMEFLE